MYLAALFLCCLFRCANMSMYNHTQHLLCLIIQLTPYDVEYDSHGITTSKLLKRAILNTGYPPAITCVITYREELRRTGRPVLVCLDLLGADAGTKLTFKCKAYDEADCQLGACGCTNGELEWTDKVTTTFEQSDFTCSIFGTSVTTHCCHPEYTYCLFCSCALHPRPCH